MSFPRRISSDDAEHLLSNRGPDGTIPDLDRVVAFVGALPAALAVRPDPGLEAMVVPRAAETARAASLEAAHAATVSMRTRRRGSPWRRRVAVVATAIALVPASMAGLALAGVTLPEPARDAFERLGIDLPNQSAVDDGRPAGRDTRDDGAEESPSKEGQGAGGAAGNDASQSGHAGGAPGIKANGDGGNGQSQGRGPESTPPGHGATPPGQGGVPPGQGAPPPGDEVVPPSEGGEPPGQAGTAPGQGQVPAGRGP
jgi:hypothetical protein